MAVKFLDGITVDGNATFGTGNKFQTTTNVLEGVGENGVYLRSAISSAANPSYSNSDDTNTGMFLPGSDVLGLSTAGSERFRITSAGNVGIGTTSPSFKLDVAGNARASYFALRTNESAPSESAFIYRPASGNLGFGTGSTERMRINSSGNVGIGTTNPAYKLSVENSLQVFSSGDTANPKIEGHLLRVTDTANDNPDVEHRYVENDSLNYGFSWFMDGGNNNFSLRRHENSANGTTVFRVNRSNSNVYIPERLGIGLTSPGARLDILQEARISFANGNQYRTRITNTDGNTRILADGDTCSIILGTSPEGTNATAVERMRINSDGNVSIGTTSSTSKLKILDAVDRDMNSSGTGQFEIGGNGYTFAVAMGNTTCALYHNSSGRSLTLGTNETARLTILGSGNIGIGTTSPSQKLEVAGAIQSNVGGRPVTLSSGQITIKGDTGGWALQYGLLGSSNSALGGFGALGGANSLSYFYIGPAYNSSNILVLKPSTGNVGIGTTAPAAKLAINGSTRIMGNGSSNNSHALEFTNSAVVIARSSSNNLNLHAYNAMVFGVSNSAWPTSTERMRITSAGNVGIGTTAPANRLNIVESNGNLGISGDSGGNMYLICSTGDLRFRVNGSSTQALVINNNLITNSKKVKASLSLAVGAITPSATTGRIDASNDIVAFSSSDIRLKNNIKTIDKALDKVNSIQGVEFDWIEKEIIHGNKGRDVGVIAQEIEKILPEVVTTRDNGYKAVKYEKIVPLLIEAIKDLSRQVDGLKRLI